MVLLKEKSLMTLMEAKSLNNNTIVPHQEYFMMNSMEANSLSDFT